MSFIANWYKSLSNLLVLCLFYTWWHSGLFWSCQVNGVHCNILSFSNPKKRKHDFIHPSVVMNSSSEHVNAAEYNCNIPNGFVKGEEEEYNLACVLLLYYCSSYSHSSVPVLPNCGLSSGPNILCCSSSFTSSVLLKERESVCVCIANGQCEETICKKVTYFSIAFSTPSRHYCSKSTCQGI